MPSICWPARRHTCKNTARSYDVAACLHRLRRRLRFRKPCNRARLQSCRQAVYFLPEPALSRRHILHSPPFLSSRGGLQSVRGNRAAAPRLRFDSHFTRRLHAGLTSFRRCAAGLPPVPMLRVPTQSNKTRSHADTSGRRWDLLFHLPPAYNSSSVELHSRSPWIPLPTF
jgi:hypothetical protein